MPVYVGSHENGKFEGRINELAYTCKMNIIAAPLKEVIVDILAIVDILELMLSFQDKLDRHIFG